MAKKAAVKRDPAPKQPAITPRQREIFEYLREVIVARLWGQRTLAEIAELTETSVSTVHRRYYAALASVRARLTTWIPIRDHTTPNQTIRNE